MTPAPAVSSACSRAGLVQALWYVGDSCDGLEAGQLEKLPALEERGSAVEQFRSLRTRLFGFRDLNTLKSILVSSGLPREGKKSFIAANLAISFRAAQGQPRSC